ncbi:cell wall-associated NlpC family hydrolase [Arthrobacter pascens]|uniref:C40 family peptidase n=1 Tax=Arthrobacter pascens TaxID=1677 RepID=UPI002861D9FD|nr:NlpC/P60 family protein [Arthrobacter pascens]MDR6557968.1 cell wall-associated NlpC family hydrolase [Arthrobacter pascens]
MSLTGPGRKAAALCATAVLLGFLAGPAQADRPAGAHPAGTFPAAVTVPAAPQVPSPDDIAAAKSSESATAAKVTDIEGLLAEAAAAQSSTFARSLEANNAYSDALVELRVRTDAADAAAARASAADKEQEKSRKEIGQLAGDLYRSGGLNPALSSFVTGNGDVLEQAATLQALSAGRSRAFETAEASASAAESLTAAAADARRAADDAAKTAESLKAAAEQANAAQLQAVSDAKAQRSVLVGQLASLRRTTVALESARIDGLERQRQQALLATVSAAPETAADQETQASGAVRPAAQGALVPAASSQSPATQAPAGRTRGAQAPAPAPVAPAPVAPGAPAPARPAAPALATPVQPAPAPSPGGSNQTAISVALGKVGKPYFYEYGGTGAYGFDCSGLVQNAFAAAGKYLPRTAAAQFAQAPVHVPLSQAQPGDLLVWGSAPGFYHVAIYLGGGRVAQALNPSAGITVTDLGTMAGMQLHPVAARY